MKTQKTCPHCKRIIGSVEQGDIEIVGLPSYFTAVCFSCPECHVILGICEGIDSVETISSNIESGLEELRKIVERLVPADKKQSVGARRKKA
jgi:hypothetical protein